MTSRQNEIEVHHSRDWLYRKLFLLTQMLHLEGDSHQQRLANHLGTQLNNHLETRGLKPEDIGWNDEDGQ
jgi:hypothetical protein